MKNILILTKKNIILAKKYLVIMILVPCVLPYMYVNIIENKVDFVYWLISFINLFIVMIVMTNIVEVADENNKRAMHLLCVAPYNRSELVLSKYMFNWMIFLVFWSLVILESVVLQNNFLHLTVLGIGFTFLLYSTYRGVMIPLQIKLGYSQIKNIFTIISLFFIIGIPMMSKLIDIESVAKLLKYTHIFQMEYWIQCALVWGIAVGINIVSCVISARIFRVKDLT